MKNNLKSKTTILKPVRCGCGVPVSLEVDRLIQENEKLKARMNE